MNYILAGIGLILLSSCSMSYVNVPPSQKDGCANVTVIQYREGVGSLLGLDGVQANLPMQGSTVAQPTNAPTISK